LQKNSEQVFRDPIKAKKIEILTAKKTVELKETIELAQVGPKSLLGAEDIINGLKMYTTSIQCISQEAEVLALTKEEFSNVRKA